MLREGEDRQGAPGFGRRTVRPGGGRIGPALRDAARTAARSRGVAWSRTLLWRLYEEGRDDRVLPVAAGVAFYGLLATFPAIAALVSLYGLFADASTIQSHLSVLSGVLPDEAVAMIADEIRRVAAQSDRALGLKVIIGFGVSLWSANAGMKAMFDALNVAYDEPETRNLVVINAWSLLCTSIGLVAALAAVGAVVLAPLLFAAIGITQTAGTVLGIVRWPLILLVVFLSFAVLYRYGPNRPRPKWRWVTAGSVLAALLWLGVSLLFSWYVANFGTYNRTYGSLGAAVGFMIWMWLSNVVVLYGAELNSELERGVHPDGPPKPS